MLYVEMDFFVNDFVIKYFNGKDLFYLFLGKGRWLYGYKYIGLGIGWRRGSMM